LSLFYNMYQVLNGDDLIIHILRGMLFEQPFFEAICGTTKI